MLYTLKSHENAFLYALSFNSFMPGGGIRSDKLKQTSSYRLQDCLNERDLLLPPGNKGFNSHKNHSMISTLIIHSINYWNFILNIYLKLDFNFCLEKCAHLVKYFVGECCCGEKVTKKLWLLSRESILWQVSKA